MVQDNPNFDEKLTEAGCVATGHIVQIIQDIVFNIFMYITLESKHFTWKKTFLEMFLNKNG